MTANTLTPLAHQLRQGANAPEDAAWRVLRTLRAEGYPVKRQYPIGPYIADFAIVRARLIIEIDGGVHDRDDVRANDELRELDLRQFGWDLMRIDGQLAMNGDYVLTVVRKYLGI